MRDPHASGGMMSRLADIVDGAGYATLLLFQALGHAVFVRRPRQAFSRLVEQFYVQIVKSIGVVSLVAVFTGMILTLQLGQEISKYGGAGGEIGTVIAAVMAREMGPFITGVILAATVGSSIAAEIGTMRVSEEIDALEIMNIDPIRFLVMPRVLSLAFAGFLLTILVDLVGVLGGALVAHSLFRAPYSDYFDAARQVFNNDVMFGILPKDIYSGLVKGTAFGLVIGAISCSAGLRAFGGALGVGRAVRRAVVASVIMTLVVGYVITWIFWA